MGTARGNQRPNEDKCRFRRRQLWYFIKFLIVSPIIWLPLIAVIACFYPWQENDNTHIIALVGASVALLSLSRTAEARRAEFISGYLSQLYTDENLWNTYHQLVYRYWDEQFCVVDKAAEEYKGIVKERIKSPPGEKPPRPPIAVDKNLLSRSLGLKSLNNPTYHPWIFHGSVEEMRLDALLGFLNGIDYYCEKGRISVGEIYRQIGAHLLILGSRKVILQYFEANDFAWEKKKGYTESGGGQSATKPARDLIGCIRVYDELQSKNVWEKVKFYFQWKKSSPGGKPR